MSNLYKEKVRRIKEAMPYACIGVDVIVGFPGETQEDFMQTYHFLNGLDISYLHVFTYSERDNTAAIHLDGVVPMEIRKKRSKMLRGLSAKKRHAVYQQQLGTRRKVLLETENRQGYMYGFTENYVRVRTPWNPDWSNTIKSIELDSIDEDGLVRFQLLENQMVSQ